MGFRGGGGGVQDHSEDEVVPPKKRSRGGGRGPCNFSVRTVQQLPTRDFIAAVPGHEVRLSVSDLHLFLRNVVSCGFRFARTGRGKGNCVVVCLKDHFGGKESVRFWRDVFRVSDDQVFVSDERRDPDFPVFVFLPRAGAKILLFSVGRATGPPVGRDHVSPRRFADKSTLLRRPDLRNSLSCTRRYTRLPPRCSKPAALRGSQRSRPSDAL